MLKTTTPTPAGQGKLKAMVALANKLARSGYVSWTLSDHCFRADFDNQGAGMTAFYDTEAALLGFSRTISIWLLPPHLQKSFKKVYAGYWVTSLVEVHSHSGFSYYMALENAFGKMILESKAGSDWTIYDSKSCHALTD